MITREKNNAYIDGENLHKGVEALGWNLDYKKFRIWLLEKYGVKTAYLFLGLIPKYKKLYQYLQESGFTLVFKEVVYDGAGKAKGNCDTDLVLQAVCDVYEQKFDKALVVASDGDYAGLIDFLNKRNILRLVISPNNKCSYLLRKQPIPLSYLEDQKNKLKLDKKEKAPKKDGTSSGSLT